MSTTADKLACCVDQLVESVSSDEQATEAGVAIDSCMSAIQEHLGTIVERTVNHTSFRDVERLGAVVKNLLPTMRKLGEAASAQARVISSSQAVSSYLRSDAYAEKIRRTAREAVVGLVGGGGRAPRVKVPGEIRKEVKRVYHVLSGIEMIGATSLDGDEGWQQPRDEANGGDETVKVDGKDKVVSRPQWKDFSLPYSQQFHRDVIQAVMLEQPRWDRRLVEAQSKRYFGTVAAWLERFDEFGNLKEAVVSKKVDTKVKQRTNDLFDQLRLHYDSSPLPQTAERHILRAAFFAEPYSLHPRMFGPEDSPMVGEVREVGDEDGPGDLLYNSFILFLDYWRKERTVKGDLKNVWVVVFPPWWSKLLRLAFWTLYNHAKCGDKSGNAKRTPLFLVPSNLFPSAHPSNLPLSTSRSPKFASDSAHPAKRPRIENKPTTKYFLCDSMIDQNILDRQDCAGWKAKLSSDPELAEGYSLEDLLKKDESDEGKDALAFINRRMACREGVTELGMRLWWTKRDNDDYVEELSRSDFISNLNKEAERDPALDGLLA